MSLEGLTNAIIDFFKLKVNFPFKTDRKDVSSFTAQLCKKSIQLVPFLLAQVALSDIYIWGKVN